MDNVVILPVVTRLDIPVERILSAAKEAEMSEVVIIGFDKDGDFYFSASKADAGDVIWCLEMAKKKLLEVEV